MRNSAALCARVLNPQSTIQRQLAAWFRHAARDLPWRRTRDAYAILVSEIMLQQTQVATVLPYYERWLARFPDFSALAEAEENDVLGVWQGLGYYRRARNLHRAAQHIVAQHAGEMPRDPVLIRALPGVGRYTAGAVASFAYDLPEPLVDANVARVLARLLDLHEPVDSPAGQRALWAEATALVPKKNARTFNGALMELGALLCTPRAPRCLECPIRPHCRAHAAGTAETLPHKKPRRKTIALSEPAAWIVKGASILLAQQTGPRWRGLWKLPALASMPDAEPLLTLDYPFTHHRITLTIYPRPQPAALLENQAWHSLHDLPPLAAPHKRAIQQLTPSQKIKQPTNDAKIPMSSRALLLFLALFVVASSLTAHADDALWQRLDSPSPTERAAARRALVKTPLAEWQSRAFCEAHPAAAIECILALCEAVPQSSAREITPHICELITTLTIEQMPASQQLALIRANRQVLTRLGPLSHDENQQLLDLWTHLHLAETKPLQRERATLMSALKKGA